MTKEIEDMTIGEIKEFVIERWAEAFKKSIFEKVDMKEVERRMDEAAAKIEESSPLFWKNLGERIVLTLECPDGMGFNEFVKIVEETVDEYEKGKKL